LKELEAQDIDISTTLNFKSMRAEVSGSSESFNVGGKLGVSAGGKIGGSIEGSGGNSVVINNYSNSTIEENENRAISDKEQKVQEITRRLENTYEFNVGGLPAINGDWKEWARNVKEKPMPISYDVSMLCLWLLLCYC
jgi:hypothetical protein